MREWRVESGWLKEREREVEVEGSFEDERSGEREEKKGLKEKREEERGGKERRVLEEERRVLRYGFASWRWRSGFKSMRRTTRWVLL